MSNSQHLNCRMSTVNWKGRQSDGGEKDRENRRERANEINPKKRQSGKRGRECDFKCCGFLPVKKIFYCYRPLSKPFAFKIRTLGVDHFLNNLVFRSSSSSQNLGYLEWDVLNEPKYPFQSNIFYYYMGRHFYSQKEVKPGWYYSVKKMCYPMHEQ